MPLWLLESRKSNALYLGGILTQALSALGQYSVQEVAVTFIVAIFLEVFFAIQFGIAVLLIAAVFLFVNLHIITVNFRSLVARI